MTHEPASNNPELEPLLLTPAETAERLGTTTEQLRRWRQQGAGPSYVDLGRRLIRYPSAAVRARHNRDFDTSR